MLTGAGFVGVFFFFFLTGAGAFDFAIDFAASVLLASFGAGCVTQAASEKQQTSAKDILNMVYSSSNLVALTVVVGQMRH